MSAVARQGSVAATVRGLADISQKVVARNTLAAYVLPGAHSSRQETGIVVVRVASNEQLFPTCLNDRVMSRAVSHSERTLANVAAAGVRLIVIVVILGPRASRQISRRVEVRPHSRVLMMRE
jgi:hypothetical protein